MPVNISFFAKQPFLNIHPSQEFKYNGTPPRRGHLMRVSSIVRANQIAEYIGAKLNPTEGYENDVCIYVKPHVKPGNNFKFEGKEAYLDICDAPDLYHLARKYFEIPVISASEYNYELLKRILPNKIINIPQQHCNFERLKRNRDGISTVGCIGTADALNFLPQGLKERLAEREIELLGFSKFYTRQDVIDFYMKIDVQIVWRPYIDYNQDVLMNPLKIQNSAAFGIPTIVYDEPVFKEMEGCYVPVHTLDEFMTELDKLQKRPSLYDKIAKKCLEKAEKYHIEKVAKLYSQLQ